MTSLKLVLFVCCCFISLSSVFSRQCNWYWREGDSAIPRRTMTCTSSSAQCLTMIVEHSSDPTPTEFLYCSTNCDETSLCNQERRIRSDTTNCQATCCNTDLCNELPAASDIGSGVSANNGTNAKPPSPSEIKEMIERMKLFAKLLGITGKNSGEKSPAKEQSKRHRKNN